MIKNAIKSIRNDVHILVKEPKSGKTETVNALTNNEEHLLISPADIQNIFDHNKITEKINDIIKKSDKPTIIIDGVFDSLCDFQISMELKYLKGLDKKIIIVSNNNEIIHSSMSLDMTNEEEDKELDFKIITNEHSLRWNQIYINYFWNQLLYGEGEINLDGDKYVMNEADFAALLISSRYWGKADQIFDIDTNTNVEYFKTITNVFFHNRSSIINVDYFLDNILMPKYLSAEKIKKYISIDGQLQYSMDNMDDIINDMSALKEVNFDLFINGIIGRQLIAKKGNKIQHNMLAQWSTIINGIVHSTDFLMPKLIAANRASIIKIIKILKNI
ncbi:hypothetical protein [Candidatus Mycoplasma mahonii]|uniref:hypothetical protein n=1 Tax=Candidatus Mycoplasma mahonii TaxID=3004105 RepID=UPI0026F07A56|nr:hypothetical protein [Candidatus Mycoplasma mahonii]WKX02751.1 hypothetical protein O3I44_01615 [Candidatus Mycoplasma mahonii]